MTTRISASVIANNAITSALIANNSISPYQLTTGAPTWTANNNLYVAGTIKVSTVSSNTITSPGTLVLQTGALSNTALTIDTSQAVGIGGPPSTGTTGLSIFGTNQVNNSLGQLCLITTSNAAIDFGGQIVLGGNYSGNTNAYWFGNIAGRKENSVDGSVSGYLALSTTTSSGVATEAMRITSAQKVGIGTSNPTSLLTVGSSSIRGAVNIIGTSSGTPSIVLDNTNASGGHNWGLYAGYTSAATFDIVDYFGSTRLTIDGSGNLGLGVTPSAWGSAFKSIDMYGWGSFASATDNTNFLNNAYNNGSGYIYKNTGYANRYLQSSGIHYWYTAPSGTAGNAITFTQAMTLDNSGNFLVAGTSAVDSNKVQIYGAKTTSAGIPQQQLNIADTTAIAAGVGGAISFSALYSGSSYTTMGSVEGVRENSTSGNYAGNLVFKTRSNGAGNNEAMRIDSSGNLLLGATSITGNGNFTNYRSTSVLSSQTGGSTGTSISRAFNVTNTTTPVASSTVTALRFLDGAGNVIGNNLISGIVCVQVTAGGGYNCWSGVFQISTNGNGTTNATFVTVGTIATRGTNPVSSINIANDGSNGAVLVQIAYTSAATTSSACYATFYGVVL